MSIGKQSSKAVSQLSTSKASRGLASFDMFSKNSLEDILPQEKIGAVIKYVNANSIKQISKWYSNDLLKMCHAVIDKLENK